MSHLTMAGEKKGEGVFIFPSVSMFPAKLFQCFPPNCFNVSRQIVSMFPAKLFQCFPPNCFNVSPPNCFNVSSQIVSMFPAKLWPSLFHGAAIMRSQQA
jgi:hypothetical protein